MIKLGLIGCGRISKKHLDVVEQLSDRVKLVAVSDIVEEKAKEAADRFNVPYYTNYLDMLDKEKMDLISICTPSGLHPQMGIEAANRGINVLTEKPMATHLHDADELIHACDKTMCISLL